MKVFLNIVGGQFGAEIAIPERLSVSPGPSVIDVLEAAKQSSAMARGVQFVDYEENVGLDGRETGSIKSITLDIKKNITSRKKNADLSERGVFRPGLLKLEEKTGIIEHGRVFTRAFQYYIEKLRSTPPKVTTTYSIDNRIVVAGKSNSKPEGKIEIENGDTVTIRLLVVARPG